LAVPDWPLTYGRFIVVPMEWLRIPNILAEHGHRVVAGIVGLLTLTMVILFARYEPRRWVRRAAAAALLAVLAQALVGGMTVLFFLPTPVSVSHALLGQLFFCLMISIALFTSRGWAARSEPISDSGSPGLRWLCATLAAAVFFQLFLGAMMRHTASGLAIYDFPLSYGRLIPRLNATAVESFNARRAEIGLAEVEGWQIGLHFSHRVWALAVCGLALWAALQIFRRHARSGALVVPALGIIVLLLVQIALGALTIWTGRQPHVATAHVGVGALILASCVVLALQSFRRVEPRRSSAMTPSPKSARARRAAL
jgi:cytochrome c oxidase assembly protein subunit 15